MGRGSGRRYVKTIKSASQSVWQTVFLVIGGLFTFFWGLGAVLALIEYQNMRRRDLPVILVMVAVSALILLQGIRIGRRRSLARSYSLIFEGDLNGTLSMDELKKCTGKEEEQIRKELDVLFRKGYFRDCTFRKGDTSRMVVISGAREGTSGRNYVYVQCESCGGVTRIPEGASEQCSFCGAPIRG